MKLSEVDKLLSKKPYCVETFRDYDTTFLITTENLDGYVKNVKGLNILSVCSSGDQFLNLVLKGAGKIDLFDVNALTFLLLKLKIGAVKALSKYEYMQFFGIISKINVLDYNLYLKIHDYLDSETKAYFDYIYEKCDYNTNHILYLTALFRLSYNPTELNIKNNTYLHGDNYDSLKHKVYIPNFIHTDLNKLDTLLDKSYDRIYLSNILDYIDKDMFMIYVTRLSEHLKNSGILYYLYSYYEADIDDSYLKENIKALFSSKTFRSVSSEKSYDKVLTLKKVD